MFRSVPSWSASAPFEQSSPPANRRLDGLPQPGYRAPGPYKLAPPGDARSTVEDTVGLSRPPQTRQTSRTYVIDGKREMMKVGENRAQNGVLDCPESKNEEKFLSIGRKGSSRFAVREAQIGLPPRYATGVAVQ
ncbi:hypothetical protein E3N88_24159 [Mikania micrantha]|uniref:Uncharacterized protein n=1 Tax=Mikania micrantha TaxID=192012 RepID=A0A5N6NI07_9ASTR|nr:hypothetical protein E3N88_24159 [Mikania micrantha]